MIIPKHSITKLKGKEADLARIDCSEIQINYSRKLGDGLESDVFLGKYKEKEVAIRVLKTNRQYIDDNMRKENFLKECLIIKAIGKHPNVVDVEGVFYKRDKDQKILECGLVMELMPKGDLEDLIRGNVVMAWEKK